MVFATTKTRLLIIKFTGDAGENNAMFDTTMERPDIRVLSVSTCILSYFNFFSDPGEHKIKKTFP